MNVLKIITGNRMYILDYGKYAKYIRSDHSSAKIRNNEDEKWRVYKDYAELFIFDVSDSKIPENLGYRTHKYVDGDIVKCDVCNA